MQCVISSVFICFAIIICIEAHQLFQLQFKPDTVVCVTLSALVRLFVQVRIYRSIVINHNRRQSNVSAVFLWVFVSMSIVYN